MFLPSRGEALFAEPPPPIITPRTPRELLPPLDPFANLVADQRSGVLLRRHADGEAAVIEVLTGEVGGQASPGMNPFRGGVEEMPDRTFGNPSSTALGAITLLAFLNLLGYIQNVLTDSTGRKRRSATFPPGNETKQNQRSEAYRVPSRATEGFQAPFTALLQDMIEYIRRGEEETPRRDRLFWPQYTRGRPAPSAHRRISQARNGSSRPFRRTLPSSRGGVGSFLSLVQHRLKLAASVMGFLNNPSPARVRRGLEQAESRTARTKRFTTSMNSWYDDLAGQNYDGTRHTSSGGGVGLLNRLMVGLGRRILGV